MGDHGGNLYEIKELEPTLSKEMLKHFNGSVDGFIRLGPKNYVMPHRFRDEAEIIYNMSLRSDDVFVASFPRSGTTVTQEMVWLLVNNFDYEKAAAIPLTKRYPFLEFYCITNPVMNDSFREQNRNNPKVLASFNELAIPGTETVTNMPSPRFIKTHLPFSLLPPSLHDTCKVVYVARDPRDAAVSFYHLTRSYGTLGTHVEFKIFWNYFVKNLVMWSPFFDHLKEAWGKRNHTNMLFLFYEDIKKDLKGTVLKVANFLGKDLSKEQLEKLVDHLSFENFKNNPSVNYDEFKQLGLMRPGEADFIRQGKSGGWRAYFDDEMAAHAQRWIADNLRDTDFRFPHIPESELVYHS